MWIHILGCVFASSTLITGRAFALGTISSHILDIATGSPAKTVKCLASYQSNEQDWVKLTEMECDDTGLIANLNPEWPLRKGVYKLHFYTNEYFSKQNKTTFFPYVEVVFAIEDPSQNYHVPLTLSNFGFSTYRGQ